MRLIVSRFHGRVTMIVSFRETMRSRRFLIKRFALACMLFPFACLWMTMVITIKRILFFSNYVFVSACIMVSQRETMHAFSLRMPLDDHGKPLTFLFKRSFCTGGLQSSALRLHACCCFYVEGRPNKRRRVIQIFLLVTYAQHRIKAF